MLNGNEENEKPLRNRKIMQIGFVNGKNHMVAKAEVSDAIQKLILFWYC